jgi:hypothetical protein
MNFEGIPLIISPTTLFTNITIVNSTYITATLLPGYDVNPIAITTNGGTTIEPLSIRFSSLPAILSIDHPSCSKLNSYTLIGCNPIINIDYLTITGYNFYNQAHSFPMRSSPTTLCAVGTEQLIDSTKYICQLQAGAKGSTINNIQLCTIYGCSSTTMFTLSYAAVPVVYNVTNSLCIQDDSNIVACTLPGGGILTIHGQNFYGNYINIQAGCTTNYTINAPYYTKINCIVPTNYTSGQQLDIRVSTNGGMSVKSAYMQFYAAPSISTISTTLTQCTLLSGTNVFINCIPNNDTSSLSPASYYLYITGNYFYYDTLISPTTLCKSLSITNHYNNVTCELSSYTDYASDVINSQLTFRLANSNRDRSLPKYYNFIYPPTVTSIINNNCIYENGITICPTNTVIILTITGTNFNNNNNTLIFGNYLCSNVNVVNMTQILCTVNATTIANGGNPNITITTIGGSITIPGGAGGGLTFYSTPTITSITMDTCISLSSLILADCSISNVGADALIYQPPTLTIIGSNFDLYYTKILNYVCHTAYPLTIFPSLSVITIKYPARISVQL